MQHRSIFLTLLLFVLNPVWAVDLKPSPAIDAVFKKAGINGTFVLYDVNAHQWVAHNMTRAQTRFIPASTFKIPNSLIGLHTAAVSSVDEVFYRHDGQPKMLKAWEQDVGLREAIRTSNVYAYQELARRIGAKRMQNNLNTLSYGNQHLGQSEDNFWLDGSLKISAVEQAQFLARLAQGQLPYADTVQSDVRSIIKLEQGTDWVLYGKTGWASKDEPGVGWLVGWVEQGQNIYAFALNIDVPMDATAPQLPTALSKRMDVAKASLSAAGLRLPQVQPIKRVQIPGSDFPVLQAVIVPPDATTYYLSGMLPQVTDKSALPGSLESYGDTRAQTISVLQRIEAALARQSLSMGDIIQLRVYLVGDPRLNNLMDFEGFQSGYLQFFATREQPLKPVRTVIQIAGLALPGALVELEATASKMK